MMQVHPEHSPVTAAIARAPQSSAANASVTGVPPNLFWANTLVSGCAIVIAIVAACAAWWNAKEAKQVQVQLMYTNAILLREGLVRSGDMVYGPEGNLEYNGRAVRQKEK